MFVTKVVVLCVISFASGASVNLDSSNLQAMVTEAIRNILGDGHTTENISNEKILEEINELSSKNVRLEQSIDILEQEKRLKDMHICSLLNNMNKLVGILSRNDSSKDQNPTVKSLYELPNKCHDLKSGTFEDENTGMETLSRTKRDVVPVPVPTHAPTQKIAFTAYLSRTHTGLSPNQVIKFDHILLNEGHGYNRYTGDFVAPVSGTYLFTFHIHSTVHTFVRLSVDGHNIVDAVTNLHGGSHDRESMSGNTVIIHVGIGQAVSVDVYDVSGAAASSENYHLCSFSGVFLYPEHPS